MRDRRDRGDRERGPSYDIGRGAGERDAGKERTPEDEATTRVWHLRLEVDAAATRAGNLSAIVQRDDWRTEYASLNKTHDNLAKQLAARAVDAKASERAQEHYTEATTKLGDISTVLTSAREPHHPVPPVSGEEAIEPLIVNGSAIPDDVIAWVAGMGASERRALVERVRHVQESADRKVCRRASKLSG